MLYCRRCALDFDRRLGRPGSPALSNQYFLDLRPCERCQGEGPTSGVASCDVVPCSGSESTAAKPHALSGHRQGRPKRSPEAATPSPLSAWSGLESGG